MEMGRGWDGVRAGVVVGVLVSENNLKLVGGGIKID